MFKMLPIQRGDKTIVVVGPNYLSIEVDYDDVPQATVEKTTSRMLEILNRHWTDKDTQECWVGTNRDREDD